MNDALEVLLELQDLLDSNGSEGYLDTFSIQQFIDNQRTLYSGASGECAA